MSQAPTIARGAESVEQVVRDELARCDAAIASAGPVLRHLLTNDDPALFSDAVVAHVRGMMLDLAEQVLLAVGPKADVADRAARQDDLAQALAEETALLAHAHALAVEARLTERLRAGGGADPVLSPLFDELAGSEDAELAALGKALIAAQTRFMQSARRMALPVAELPTDLLDAVTSALRSADAAVAEQALRESREEQGSRLALLDRLVALVLEPRSLLSVEEVGLATFASALAKGSQQGRDRTVLSLADGQAPRFALALRAAGLGRRAVEQQFQILHPDLSLPDGFETLSVARATALLAAAA